MWGHEEIRSGIQILALRIWDGVFGSLAGWPGFGIDPMDDLRDSCYQISSSGLIK